MKSSHSPKVIAIIILFFEMKKLSVLIFIADVTSYRKSSSLKTHFFFLPRNSVGQKCGRLRWVLFLYLRKLIRVK